MTSASEGLKVVGTRPIRPDGIDKVIGRATYGADMVMPDMLWAKVKRSPHAHARIKSINNREGPGFARRQAVVTAADFPDIPVGRGVHGRRPDEFPRPVAQLPGLRQGAL